MPLPATIATRTIHCDIRDATGDPASAGAVTFTNHWALYDEQSHLILSPGSYSADLVNGKATVVVPATDAAGITPSGRTLTVTVATPTWSDTYDVHVPSGASELQLSWLPPAISPPPLATYATLGALEALKARVAQLETQIGG
ncbi:hypothetical protein [Glycomyces tarimensis]